MQLNLATSLVELLPLLLFGAAEVMADVVKKLTSVDCLALFLDLPLDEDEGEGCRIALLLGPHTLVAAVRNLEEFWC